MNVKVVIGANYGDEGKGLLTEHLCRLSSKPLVVLSNGGCQRGHTINSARYGRHVFQHFGSGTFLGAPTLFASKFLINPMQFIKERNELKSLMGDKLPDVFYHHSCYLQFPVDIFLNRFVEDLRGKNRHGSVGAGIWETMLRREYFWSNNTEELTPITFKDFVECHSKYDLVDRLKKFSSLYLDYRLKSIAEKNELNGMTYNDLWTQAKLNPLYEIFFSEGMFKHFVNDCIEMYHCTTPFIDYIQMKDICDTCIFEQGQGLCLDADYVDDARYTTPSSTGISSVMPILSFIGKDVESMSVEYVTRSYLTCHGNGPFPEEDPSMKFPDFTNQPNEWQGTLRFGQFDDDAVDRMVERISLEIASMQLFGIYEELAKANSIDINLNVTHCNEVPPNKFFIDKATRLSYEDDSASFTYDSSKVNSLLI